MGYILIFDSEQARREQLTGYLSECGYNVKGIAKAEEAEKIFFPEIDLMILNLFPDAPRTWDFYRMLRIRHPHLPVLLYVHHSFAAFKSLKQVIDSVLDDPRKRRRVTKAGRTSATTEIACQAGIH